MVIFAIGALGTAALTIHTIRTNASNKLRIKATSAIQEKIEDLRLDVKAGKTISSGADQFDTLNRSWVVYDDQPSIGLKTVVVEIRWAQAPITDARFLKYAAILSED